MLDSNNLGAVQGRGGGRPRERAFRFAGRLRTRALTLSLLCGLACSGRDDAVDARAASALVPGSGPAPANLIVISVDTLRADHLGAYGYGRATSPHFDRLAGQGVQFMRAFSPTSWTLPGHASMLTGRNPLHHGAVTWKSPIDEDVPLLAEILSAQGFRTLGVVNGTFVKPGYGFDRGMQSYEVHESQQSVAHQEAVLKALDAGGPEPFFYFLHYMRVHAPYRPPDGGNPFLRPYEGEITSEPEALVARWKARGEEGPVVDATEREYLVDLYDGAILAMDGLLAQVLGRLDRPEFANTYVILTSDHGEEFMEHGFLWHSVSLFDEVLNVPLMIRGPGIPAGLRIDATAGLIDIVPTALDLLGLDVPEGLDGRSLRETWASGAAPERTLLLRTNFPTGGGVRLGARTSTEKLILYPEDDRVEFYRLTSDPNEHTPMPPDENAEGLKRRLEETLEAGKGDGVRLSAEEVEQLRALGYLDLSAPEEAQSDESATETLAE